MLKQSNGINPLWTGTLFRWKYYKNGFERRLLLLDAELTTNYTRVTSTPIPAPCKYQNKTNHGSEIINKTFSLQRHEFWLDLKFQIFRNWTENDANDWLKQALFLTTVENTCEWNIFISIDRYLQITSESKFSAQL